MALDASAFLALTHVTKVVEFPDGVSRPLNFKRLAHADLEVFRLAMQSPDDGIAGSATSRLIRVSLVEDDGQTPVIPTMDLALRLEDKFAKRLLTIIMGEVNGKTTAAAKKLRAVAKKKSRPTPRTGSGTSSP